MLQTNGGESLDKAWEKIKTEARPLFDEETLIYETFLLTSVPAITIEDTLYVSVESALGKEMLNNSFISRLSPLMKKYFAGEPQLKFIVSSEEKILKMTKNPEYVATKGRLIGINPNQTTDSLVVGKFNEQATRAARQVVEAPGQKWNPLFVYGDTGLGKSHLLSATGNQYHAFYPSHSIKLVNSQEFTREIYEALSRGGDETERLKRAYEGYELLMVDDVQLLAKREKTNEILFHILNDFINKKKPVILASDKAPQSLTGFEGRMLSRFRAGLQIKIEAPDEETIKKILTKKLKEMPGNRSFSPEALVYVAQHCSTDIRVIEGVVSRLLFSTDDNEVISLERSKSLLGQGDALIEQDRSAKDDVKLLIEAVCTHYGVSVAQVLGNGRQAQVARIRQIAMYILRKKKSMTFAMIGKELGGRDHSTVMSACQKVEEEAATDPVLRETIEKLFKGYQQ